jgi:hypothetical protein
VAPGSGQSSIDEYDLYSDDEEYFMAQILAQSTPRRRDHSECIWSVTQLYLNSPCKSPNNLGHAYPTSNDYHTDPRRFAAYFGYQISWPGGIYTKPRTTSM